MSIEGLAGGAAFQRAFKGDIVTPKSPAYDEARRVWNGDIDRRPLAVVKATDDADVAAALRLAVDNGLPLAVRGGGHSYRGHSVCDAGLTIDLSRMRDVVPDAGRQRVTIGGGALLGNVDGALVPLGQVMPAGVVSHTGMPGLALGGGVGYLSRQLGLTCDQFIRLRVVTADGDVLHASDEENPDLFWALRGGGGNFGVVTEFECGTHTLGPVQAGALVFRVSEAPDIILALSEVLQAGPRELSMYCSYGVAPERFGLAGQTGGERLLSVYVVYRGNPEDAILTELRHRRKPLRDTVTTADYLTVQRLYDKIAVAGTGWYVKSGYTREITRPLLEWMAENSVEYRTAIASPEVEWGVYTLATLGGAVQDVPEADSAYSGREANWHVAIEAGFTTPGERSRIVPWLRGTWEKTQPMLDMKTSYVNLNCDEGPSRLEKDIFGPEKFTRLQRVKSEYDPANVFSSNWNIPPLPQEKR